MPTNAQRGHRLLQGLVSGLCIAYVLAVAAAMGLHAWLPALPPPLQLLDYLMPYIFAPLLVLLPLALLVRAWAGVAACLLPTALFVVLYGGLFLPSLTPDPRAEGSDLIVMTFNLGPGVSDPEHLTAAIAAQQADLVGLQEVYPSAEAAIRQKLGERFPWSASGGDVALLSRYPLRDVETFRPAGTGRTALKVAADAPFGSLAVYVVHPRPPGIVWRRGLPAGITDRGLEEQMADVVQRARSEPYPVIVLGDFNMGDQSRAHALLATELRDAFRQAGWGFGFSFPHGLHLRRVRIPGPIARLDYVFTSPELQAQSAYVGCDGSSDHCYVVAHLRAGPGS